MRKSASHMSLARYASSGISKIMTSQQEKKFAKIAEEYKLDTRDMNQPLAKRFTHKEIVDIVEKTSGMTHDILALLDCTRSQWQSYLEKHPDVKEICKSSREAVVDRAEARMLQAVNSENEMLAEKASEFVLKTLGKSRGWGQDPSTQINVNSESVDIRQIFGLS